MAIPTIILVNQTASPIVLGQLGVTVPASGSITVTGIADAPSTVSAVQNDEGLNTQVGSGNIALTVNSTVLTTSQSSSFLQPGSSVLGSLSNFKAVIDPASTDDEGIGYSVGSRWVNTISGDAFTCVVDTEDAAVWRRDNGGVTSVPSFAVFGILTTGGALFRFRPRVAGTIVGVQITVGTAPTGSAIIVDVNLNGSTIFTTQSNRPQIAISGIEGNSTTINVATVAVNDEFTVDIDQIGSTIAGAYLIVSIEIAVDR